MSDFWTRALGVAQTPAPARDQAPLDAWWARRPAPAPAPPAAAPQAPPEPPRQARSAASTERCPHCGSGDYFRANPETRARCYTCGYPILHTTSGMVSTDRTPATPARQTRQSREGGYQPQNIVGRIT